MKIAAYVRGVGVLGPGLGNWEEASAALSGARAYEPQRAVLPMPALLPPAERRRIGRVVKLALAVASEATTRAGARPADLASVFSSSGGDGHNCHEICEALAAAQREISPTRFSNSVHNAPAGYWSIATGAMCASNVLCAYDASFGAGVLEAVVQVAADRESVLLAAYDTEYPQPLRAKRPIPDAFGIALVFAPQRGTRSIARIAISLTEDPAEEFADPQLEALRRSIPAARGLPLLRQLAERRGGRTIIDYLDDTRISIEVEPCG